MGSGYTRSSLLDTTPAELADLYEQTAKERIRRKADMAEAVRVGMAGNAAEIIKAWRVMIGDEPPDKPKGGQG